MGEFNSDSEEDDTLMSKRINDGIKSKTYIWLLVINSCLGAFYFGFEQCIINTSSDKLASHF